MRPAKHSDIGYFVRAGREFCAFTPFQFDAPSYAEAIHALLDDPNVIAIVGDECHCVARLAPNFYNAGEVVARIISTWGKGGLECFREVERLCTERGARFIMADSWIEPRIERFYERQGMTRMDSVFIKEL